MSLLRDIIARFSVSVDDSDLKKLDKDLATTRKNLDAVATQGAVAFAAMGYGAFELVKLASDATENMNVLTQAFGNQADGVVMWSEAMGKALGRSKYALQEYAGRFGSYLEPLFKGTDQDIAGMSEQLSQLAVDLASFYNTSEEESMMRLFSGLSGETEAVRRLGIDISDDALTEFNTKQSGGKDQRHSRNLNLQEKTALRFAKILKDTEAKQGDAIRTQDELANSTKRLQGQFHELAVEAGKKLVPIIKDTFNVFSEYVMPGMEDLAETTNVVQHGFEMAGGAAVTLAASFALANKAALANTLILGGLLLAFDELRSGAEGAKTELDRIAGRTEGDKTAWRSMNDSVAQYGIGGADIGVGVLQDIMNLPYALNGGEDYGFGANTSKALARFRANASGEESEDRSMSQAFENDRQAAIEARDPNAFFESYRKNGRVLPDDPQAAYMSATKADYERGKEVGYTPHLEQDIANGVAPLTDTDSANAWRNAGRTTLPSLPPIQINMYGDNNEKKVADELGRMLRETNAAVGDEKSSEDSP